MSFSWKIECISDHSSLLFCSVWLLILIKHQYKYLICFTFSNISSFWCNCVLDIPMMYCRNPYITEQLKSAWVILSLISPVHTLNDQCLSVSSEFDYPMWHANMQRTTANLHLNLHWCNWLRQKWWQRPAEGERSRKGLWLVRRVNINGKEGGCNFFWKTNNFLFYHLYSICFS